MNLAIFADVHGRALQAFQVVARWERETGTKIDLILQCGDVGIYPNLDRLDRPTAKRGEIDRAELGWHDYFVTPHPDAERILSQTDANMLCVRGNHEDHDFLDDLEAQFEGPAFPVDCYGRVQMLKTGHLFSFEKAEKSLDILGIGRLGHPAGLTKWDNPVYLQDYEMDKLNRLGRISIDILMTHDVTQDSLRLGWGLEESKRIIEKYRPSYHFHGHAGPFGFQKAPNNVTLTGRLNDFTWDMKTQTRVPENSMAILQWNGPNDHQLEMVNEKWLVEYGAHTWKYLI